MKSPKRELPNGCPYCGSDNTERTTEEYNAKTKLRAERRYCIDCNKEWVEQYKFLKWIEIPL